MKKEIEIKLKAKILESLEYLITKYGEDFGNGFRVMQVGNDRTFDEASGASTGTVAEEIISQIRKILNK